MASGKWMEYRRTIMKVYGYENDSEDLIELGEVSIMASISEVKNLLNYLENVINEHSKVVGQKEMHHSHLRDWDENWESGQPDIVIVTNEDE